MGGDVVRGRDPLRFSATKSCCASATGRTDWSNPSQRRSPLQLVPRRTTKCELNGPPRVRDGELAIATLAEYTNAKR